MQYGVQFTVTPQNPPFVVTGVVSMLFSFAAGHRQRRRGADVDRRDGRAGQPVAAVVEMARRFLGERSQLYGTCDRAVPGVDDPVVEGSGCRLHVAARHGGGAARRIVRSKVVLRSHRGHDLHVASHVEDRRQRRRARAAGDRPRRRAVTGDHLQRVTDLGPAGLGREPHLAGHPHDANRGDDHPPTRRRAATGGHARSAPRGEHGLLVDRCAARQPRRTTERRPERRRLHTGPIRSPSDRDGRWP